MKMIPLFIEKFNRDRTTSLAASVAFYTILSLAPILILFVMASAYVSDRIQHKFLSETQGIIGDQAAQVFEVVMNNAKLRPDLVSISGVFGFISIVFSAGLVFGELKSSLNQIFEKKDAEGAKDTFLHQVFIFVQQRIFQVILAFIFILMIITTLIVSTLISIDSHTQHLMWMRVLNIGVSVVIYMILFTLLFSYVPDAEMPLRVSYKGGLLTSVLFVIGKELIGIYIGRSAIGSSYGAAGSVVVLLVWVYYSTLITFVGAHVSYLLKQEESSG